MAMAIPAGTKGEVPTAEDGPFLPIPWPPPAAAPLVRTLLDCVQATAHLCQTLWHGQCLPGLPCTHPPTPPSLLSGKCRDYPQQPPTKDVLPHTPLHGLPKVPQPKATLCGPSPPWLLTPYLLGPGLGWTPGDPPHCSQLTHPRPQFLLPSHITGSALCPSGTAGLTQASLGGSGHVGAVILSGIPAATLLSNGVGAGRGLRSGHWSLGQGVGQRRLQPCLWLGGTSLPPLAETSCHSGHKPPSQSGGPSKPSLWLGSSQTPGWLAPNQRGARGPACPAEAVGCGTPTFPETPPPRPCGLLLDPRFQATSSGRAWLASTGSSPAGLAAPSSQSAHSCPGSRPPLPPPTYRGEGWGVFQAASK